MYESTVYPGATEEDCVPVLESESGLKCGSDFYVGYSPERINPGDKTHTFTNIIKIVSGQNNEILDIVAEVASSRSLCCADATGSLASDAATSSPSIDTLANLHRQGYIEP